jgi:hypothetical protein
MKTFYFLIMLIIGMVTAETFSSFTNVGSVTSPDGRQTKKAIRKKEGTGFAVLELFTSEGCSSCPPADKVLADIQQESKGKSVYILAYHVDYWNRLGWKDAFSSPDYSGRQEQYGRWLEVSPIYTPQVVVNGKYQFVGSDESAIHQAISKQMANHPASTLVLRANITGEQLRVEYQISPPAGDNRLLIAIIQKSARTQVERGENAGQLLSHVQIVRKLQSVPLTPSGNGMVELPLPKGFNFQTGEVLGLVQDQQNGEILAAARADQ